jgi:hypothetical protein
MDVFRELSVADADPFKYRQHVDHAKYLVELEPTFNILASADIGKECVKAMAAVTHIRSGTMKDWRLQLLKNLHLRPYESCNAHCRALNEDEEAEVLQELHERHLSERINYPHELSNSRQKRCGWPHMLRTKKSKKRKNGADCAKKRNDEAHHSVRTDGRVLS